MRRAGLLLACAFILPACGGSSGSSGGGPLPLPPAGAPAGVSVVVGDGQLTVQWNAVFNTTQYTIYGAAAPGVTVANALTLPGGMRIENLTVSPQVIPGLTNGTTYYLFVTASNAGGEGPPSTEVSGTPVPVSAAPTGVTAAAGNQSVQLNWTAVPFAASYNVYRATTTGVTPANYTGLAGGLKYTNVPRPFTATPLTNLTTYYFVVTAVNAMGESLWSAEVPGTPVPPPPPAPGSFTAVRGNGQVTLDWSTVGTATSYTVYGATVTGVSPANYAGLAGGFRILNATRPLIIGSLANGTTYYFIVTASNTGGEGAPSTEVSATPTPPPPAPTSPGATGGDGLVTLTWTAAPTATSYVVYSAEVPGVTPANWASLAGGRSVTVSGAPYERRGLDAGVTLYFIVSGVNDAGEGGPSAQVSATPTGGGTSEARILPFRPIDAEYNRSSEKIVAVSSFPHRLNIFDPVTQANTIVGLPAAPLCVSVGPSGTHAAVGHDGWISYVNLGTATLEQTLRTSTVAGDIVLAGNGFVYVMPAVDQWEALHCVQLSSGTETLSTGNSVRAGTYMKLHPGGTSIYGGNIGLSPADIERYVITGGTAAYGSDSPYHGDYPSGGPIWIQEDGLRLFTRPGSSFRTLAGAAGDMTYNGSLSQTTLIQTLDHRTASGRIAAVPDGSFTNPFDDTELHVYTAAALGFDRRLLLPPFRAGGNTWASHGRFAFIHGDGVRCFVLVKSDARSGLNTSHGIVEVSLTGTGAPVIPTGVSLRPSTATSATVSWDRMPTATSYKVYWATVSGVQPGNYASLPGGGSVATATTSSSTGAVPAGSTVYVVVTAVTASGEGAPSPEAALLLQSSASTPSIPTNVSSTAGNGQLTISWNASANATSYVVYGGRTRGADKDTFGTVPGGFRTVVPASPAVIPGLSNDQPYFLRVVSRNLNGEGIASPEFVAVPTASAAPALQPLTYRVIDAEYSKSLNRIVSVASSPSSLHIFDPITQTDTAVALPAAPSCVAVSPDGLSAAVGYNGSVSHVNLQTATLVNTWGTASNVFDIVLAGNGVAYVTGSNESAVRGITLSTGASTSGSGFYFRSSIKLHASGSSFYGANNGVSPSDVEKWSIAGPSPVRLYDSPYHGDFAMGSNLWTSGDGTFLVTRWGTRFSTTATQATDIRYQGRLHGLVGVESVDHSTATAWVAAVPMNPSFPTLLEDNRVQWFDDLYNSPWRASMLPPFDVSGTKYPAHGKFAFFSSDGTKLHVVMMADVTSGLLNDFAVVTFN